MAESGCNTFCLFIHQLMGSWVVSTFQLLLTAMNIHVYVFVWAYISFGYIPGSGILGYVVTLCLMFWRTAKLFLKAAAAFYISTSDVWGFQFLPILAHTCYCLSWGNFPFISVWFLLNSFLGVFILQILDFCQICSKDFIIYDDFVESIDSLIVISQCLLLGYKNAHFFW